jgi:hypothetical protein
MEISLTELSNIIASSVDVGVQSYIRTNDPDRDRIKQSEAKRYLARLGFQPVMLKKWVDDSLLTPIKVGDAQNSAVWYSLAEIKKLVFSIRTHQIIVKV